MIPLALALVACIDGPGRGFATVERAALVPSLDPHDDVRVEHATLWIHHVRLDGEGLPAPEPGHAHRTDHEDEHDHDTGGPTTLLRLRAEGPVDLLGGPVPLGPLPAEWPGGTVDHVALEVDGVRLVGSVGETAVDLELDRPFAIAGEAALAVDRDSAPALALTVELQVDASVLRSAGDEASLVEALRASGLALRVEALE